MANKNGEIMATGYILHFEHTEVALRWLVLMIGQGNGLLVKSLKSQNKLKPGNEK
jgi:hypothetical protein